MTLVIDWPVDGILREWAASSSNVAAEIYRIIRSPSDIMATYRHGLTDRGIRPARRRVGAHDLEGIWRGLSRL